MSNYLNLEYCLNCRKVTDHEWHDDTPLHHEYTVECKKCGLKTEAVNFHNIDAQNMLDLREVKQ